MKRCLRTGWRHGGGVCSSGCQSALPAVSPAETYRLAQTAENIQAGIRNGTEEGSKSPQAARQQRPAIRAPKRGISRVMFSTRCGAEAGWILVVCLFLPRC